MPLLPKEPGLNLWEVDGVIKYVGQTRTPLAVRLGSQGYATISAYNTLARQRGKTNGDQQSNCRINALANAALCAGQQIVIWYRVTSVQNAAAEEASWMACYGAAQWNRRVERLS